MFHVLARLGSDADARLFLGRWLLPGPVLVPLCRELIGHLLTKSDALEVDDYDAVLRVLSSDPSPQACSLAADVLHYIIRNLPSAQEMYKKALDLNPSMIGTTLRFFDLLVDGLDDHAAVRAHISQSRDYSAIQEFDPAIFDIWSDTLVTRMLNPDAARDFHRQSIRESGGRASHAAPAALFLLRQYDDVTGSRDLYERAFAVSQRPGASEHDRFKAAACLHFGVMFAFDLNNHAISGRLLGAYLSAILVEGYPGNELPPTSLVIELIAFVSGRPHELCVVLGRVADSHRTRALVSFIAHRINRQ